MAKHRSHAKKHVVHHARPKTASDVLPFQSASLSDMEKALPSFFSWPSYLFEMMFTPWRNFTPVTPWMGISANSNMAIPHTQSHETDKAYIYTAELPGLSAKQIALTVQNGSIMLRVEESEDRHEQGRHIRHSRSVRRAFVLPVYTNAPAITAKLKGGVLTIAIPKSDKPVAPKSHSIDITS